MVERILDVDMAAVQFCVGPYRFNFVKSVILRTA